VVGGERVELPTSSV